jgi:hypothetical protein
MEKKCFKCKSIKPLTDFYKHKQMTDGHVNKCKECNKKDVSGNYINNLSKPGYLESERKRGRQKYHRLYVGVYKSNKSSMLKWCERYPEKVAAKLKSSNVKKEFEFAEKHHWSYNEEHYKDVIQLYKKDHMKAHRFIVYDQERFMYRRFDTNELLDTKEKHKEFILNCIQTKED